MGAFNVTIVALRDLADRRRRRRRRRITSQLIVAATLDHFGLLGLKRTELTPATVLGFLLLVAGVVLVTAR